MMQGPGEGATRNVPLAKPNSYFCANSHCVTNAGFFRHAVCPAYCHDIGSLVQWSSVYLLGRKDTQLTALVLPHSIV